MGIFYREKAFVAGKKIRKNDFAPSEKYAYYAPDAHIKLVTTTIALHSGQKETWFPFLTSLL